MTTREEELAGALTRIRGVNIDAGAARAHVMRPEHTIGVRSDRGREDAPRRERFWPPFPVYTLNVPGFIRALEEKLTNNVAGYSIRLNEGDSTLAVADWNWAQEPADGSESWTPDVRMHVASLSKIMTAIAMTKVLADAGIPASAPIAGYLPEYWVKGPNVDQITFAELMTHTSGLAYGISTSRADFEFMKSQIAAGTTHVGQYAYQNMNFGLCRILLATINGNIPVDWAFPGFFGDALNDLFWDFITISSYVSYVNGNVFAPSGVTGPDFSHDPADALAYDFPVTGNGWDSGDLLTMAGAAGWHMSVDELLSVMAVFRGAGTIVSPAQAQGMLDDGFGIDWSVSTPLGSYYAKNGFWYNGSGQMEQGVAFFLPMNMDLVVLVNSPVGPAGEFLYTLVSQAYDDNIVELLI